MILEICRKAADEDNTNMWIKYRNLSQRWMKIVEYYCRHKCCVTVLPQHADKFEQRQILYKCYEIPPVEEMKYLYVLNFAFENRSTIPVMPSCVKILEMRYNGVQIIENLPEGLIELDIMNNNISVIEKLPKSLQKLNMANNKIRDITGLPEGLRELNLPCNNITEIKNLPSGLKILNLCTNKIKTIENLPDSIELLDISYNPIKNITIWPNNLISLCIGDRNYRFHILDNILFSPSLKIMNYHRLL